MPFTRLEEFLNRERINYKRIVHSRAYTAQKTAAYAHISGNEIAKSVVIKIDGKIAMAVLPASYQLDLDELKRATAAKDVRLATESEFKDVFKDCEVGAQPPFGNLYNLEVFVAEKLTEDTNIAFNACNHAELIQMTYKDYQRLVHPTVIKIARTAVAEA
ncbi:aminoacyl-tRNA deacylase [Carboxylicivirga linearis]|uniref:YbaK/EbsC family protein n=1 Tax=Carboxylicivirga linearis TaxID=1628157 RepID=A0ABS5JU54_9BACT|nr:YbaK/EbsC family protein [Carboxylicivirga linearis]MBS2098367.1 YbaK/EbsC family protein [Carboxylicivirga linearis]